MIVTEKKPVPIYEITCCECGSKIQYKKSEVFTYHIQCPVCGVSLLADAIQPVRYEESNEQMRNYLAKLVAQAQSQATNIFVPWNKCDKICSHKTDLGYCAFTVCINPDYNGNQNYGESNTTAESLDLAKNS